MDVFHQGSELEPVEIWNDAGGLWRALSVQLWSSHSKDGQPWEQPQIHVRPDADAEGFDLSPDEAREGIRQLRAHLDAVEAYIERYAG